MSIPTMRVLVVEPVPDPVAYRAGFKRKLLPGEYTVPDDFDFRRLLKKGSIEPLDELAAKRAGRPLKVSKPAAVPHKKEKDSDK